MPPDVRRSKVGLAKSRVQDPSFLTRSQEVAMITANTVANYFLAFAQECEEPITNLKLNKLVYYTQAWHLALFNTPLFDEEIEAWVHGPVLSSLYENYKQFKWNPIIVDDLNLEEIKQQFNPDQQNLLNDVVEVYFPETAYALEQLTHSEDPWVCTREGLAPDECSSRAIAHGLMQKYYAKILTEDFNTESITSKLADLLDDRRWNKLFASPEAQAYSAMRRKEVIAEYEAGETIPYVLGKSLADLFQQEV